MKDFRGKTAFITGAAGGIGLSMAQAFGRAGMNIAVADIDRDAAHAAVEQLAESQIRAVAIPCDVSIRAEVQRAAQETIAAFGKVHIVCNNAGVAIGGQVGMIAERDWDWIIDVNLKSVVYGVETFLPLLKSHGEGGHIVNTASIAGLVSAPGLEPYSATKYAVVALSEGWAMQLGLAGIGMSVLCPGFVRTRIHESYRVRQDRYGRHDAAGAEATKGEAEAAVLNGIDPGIVGRRVLEAVAADEFYIFTHPEMKQFVEMRFQMILAAFERAEASEALKGQTSASADAFFARPATSES